MTIPALPALQSVHNSVYNFLEFRTIAEVRFQNPDTISPTYFRRATETWIVKNHVVVGRLALCVGLVVAAITLIGIAGGGSVTFLAQKKIIALSLGLSGGGLFVVSLGGIGFVYLGGICEYHTVAFCAPGAITCRVDRNRINEDPNSIWHSFVEALIARENFLQQTVASTNLCAVQFRGERGQDTGALSREFLSELVSALLSHNNMCDEITDGDEGHIPYVNSHNVESDDCSLYEQLGKLMVHVSIDNRVVIGEQFDPLVFEVIALVELNNIVPFDMLSFAEKTVVYNKVISDKIAKYQKAELQEKVKDWTAYKTMVNDCLSDEIPEKLIEYGNKLINDYYLDEEELKTSGNFDWNKVKEKLKDEVLQTRLDSYAKPLLAIAKGVHTTLRTTNQRISDINCFRKNIQGELNRVELANRIQSFPQQGMQRNCLGWLQEWIRDEATHDELKKFLILVTGVGCMLPGRNLNIEFFQQRNFMLRAEACTFKLQIYLGDDYLSLNKETFIQGIKHNLINPNGFNVI